MKQNQRRHRGTILILVVAVLGLLVIMGTAYLATSRSTSNAARQMNEVVNLDLATRSVMSEVQNTIYQCSVNPVDGTVLGNRWVAGKSYAAGNAVFSPSNGKVYTANAVHTASSLNGPPPSASWTEVTAAPASVSLPRFFDFPEWGATTPGISSSSLGLPDQTWLVATTVPTTNLTADFTYTRSGRFNPKTGAYDLAFTTPYVSAMGPTSGSTAYDDAVWSMLPFSSPGGVRYRYALRIIDTSRMANLNTGQAFSAIQTAAQGQTIFSPWLACGAIFNGDTIAQLNSTGATTNGVRGRLQPITDFSGTLPTTLAGWQDIVMGYERFGINPAAGITSVKSEWFDFTDELELRSYGNLGNGYMARPAANHTPSIWPATLDAGKTFRQNYTTYSYDRKPADVNTAALVTSLPYSVTAGSYSNNKWAGQGTTASLQNLEARPIDLSSPSTDSDDGVMLQAVRIANAMYASGYGQDECWSYALNYIAQTSSARRYSSLIYDSSATAYKLYMASATATSSTYTVNGLTAGIDYFAYSAQPFINEVALSKVDPNTDGDNNISTRAATDYYLQGFAVELMNPYGSTTDVDNKATIDLTGWRLRVTINGTTDYTATIGTTINQYISNNGLLVVRMSGDTIWTSLGSVPSVAPTFNDSSSNDLAKLTVDATSMTVYLERPDLHASGGWITVDKMDLATIPALTQTAAKSSKQRANYTTINTPTAAGTTTVPGLDPWLCSSTAAQSGVGTTDSIGLVNPASTVSFGASDIVHFGVYLPDRLQKAVGTLKDPSPSIIELGATNTPIEGGHHIGDLTRVSRVAIRYHSASTFANKFVTIPEVAGNSTVTLSTGTILEPQNLTNSQFPQEGRFFFDFSADPRAGLVLDNVTTVDRASDGYDQLGIGLADTIDELRTPGRINVNTASFGVLCALIQGACPNMSTTDVANAASLIIAYRQRIAPVATTSGTYTSTLTAPNFNVYTGQGIRSLSELAIPLGVADGTIAVKSANTPAYEVKTQGATGYGPSANFGLQDFLSRGPTVSSAGATWAKIFASATVRSDAFVVYGYLEAIKQNPNFTGTYNNDVNWYKAATRDTSSTAAENILVSSRRFIAIVDRSWCNAGRGSATVLPKIVAYKELPR